MNRHHYFFFLSFSVFVYFYFYVFLNGNLDLHDHFYIDITASVVVFSSCDQWLQKKKSSSRPSGGGSAKGYRSVICIRPNIRFGDRIQDTQTLTHRVVQWTCLLFERRSLSTITRNKKNNQNQKKKYSQKWRRRKRRLKYRILGGRWSKCVELRGNCGAETEKKKKRKEELTCFYFFLTTTHFTNQFAPGFPIYTHVFSRRIFLLFHFSFCEAIFFPYNQFSLQIHTPNICCDFICQQSNYHHWVVQLIMSKIE